MTTSKQVKLSQRNAAGLAKTTQGRSRTFIDRSKYDRQRDKGRGKQD